MRPLFSLVAIGLVMAACKQPAQADTYALEDAVVLTRPDSEDVFFLARVTAKNAKGAVPFPVARVSVKNARGDVREVGVCDSPATTVTPQEGAWCLFSAPEQRAFVDFSTRFEVPAKTPKKALALVVRDTTMLPSVAAEVPKVTGSVQNDGRGPVRWLGTVALARNAAGAIVGAGMQRETGTLAPGARSDVLLPLRFLTERPIKVELVPFGEEP